MREDGTWGHIIILWLGSRTFIYIYITLKYLQVVAIPLHNDFSRSSYLLEIMSVFFHQEISDGLIEAADWMKLWLMGRGLGVIESNAYNSRPPQENKSPHMCAEEWRDHSDVLILYRTALKILMGMNSVLITTIFLQSFLVSCWFPVVSEGVYW